MRCFMLEVDKNLYDMCMVKMGRTWIYESQIFYTSFILYFLLRSREKNQKQQKYKGGKRDMLLFFMFFFLVFGKQEDETGNCLFDVQGLSALIHKKDRISLIQTNGHFSQAGLLRKLNPSLLAQAAQYRVRCIRGKIRWTPRAKICHGLYTVASRLERLSMAGSQKTGPF